MSEEDQITNIQTHALEDGGLALTMDISSDNQFILITQGLQYVTDHMIINDKLIVADANEFDVGTRTVVMSNEMANILFHFGCISGLLKGIKDK